MITFTAFSSRIGYYNGIYATIIIKYNTAHKLILNYVTFFLEIYNLKSFNKKTRENKI